MDFMNRTVQQPARPASTNGSSGNAASITNANGNVKKKPGPRLHGKLFGVSTIVLLFSITILIAALAGIIAFGGNGAEGKFINKKEYQVVVIKAEGSSDDLVYFGHITDLNSQFIRLVNIFYIQKDQTTGKADSNTNTLKKLGCSELHGPEDEMIINRDQIYYWENLKSSGQVTQKIGEYYKQYGNKCPSSSSSANQSSNAQNPTSSSASNSSASSTATDTSTKNNAAATTPSSSTSNSSSSTKKQ